MTFLIAEIGINHNGDINIAKKLIEASALANCQAVKFQKRTIDVVYSPDELRVLRNSPYGETNGDLKFNSGYGSVATAYGVRAWMRYRGDTNALVGSGNVSSVTDHSTGSFSMNFTTAMVDANYAIVGAVGYNDTSLNIGITHSGTHSAPTTTSMRFSVGVNYNSNLSDERYISIAIVR